MIKRFIQFTWQVSFCWCINNIIIKEHQLVTGEKDVFILLRATESDNILGSKLNRGKTVPDKSGKYEQEIAIFFFDDAANSRDKILTDLPDIHRRFEAEISFRNIELPLLEYYWPNKLMKKMKELGFIFAAKEPKDADNSSRNGVFSLQWTKEKWNQDYGENKLCLLIYQYTTTPGIAVRILATSDISADSKNLLRQVFDKNLPNRPDRFLTPITDWKKWLLLIDDKDYPVSSYSGWDISIDDLYTQIEKLVNEIRFL